MSDVVYVVIEDIGEYEDRFQSVVGIFTDLDEGRASEAERPTDREIETWSTGAGSTQQMRTLHGIRHQVANPNFNAFSEVVWKTVTWESEVDASAPIDQRDSSGARSIQRGGWTPEEAEQRLTEALKTYKPDLTPTPVPFRYPQRAYALSELVQLRQSLQQ